MMQILKMEIETNLLEKKIECQDQQIKKLFRRIQSNFYFQIIVETNIYFHLLVTFLRITKKNISQILKAERTSLNQEHVKLTKKIPY